MLRKEDLSDATALLILIVKSGVSLATSRTLLKIGIENSPHQIDTETKQCCTVKYPSGNPNSCGYLSITRFTASRSPPPMYPHAQPKPDTFPKSCGSETSYNRAL